jgi:hypothetical protein
MPYYIVAIVTVAPYTIVDPDAGETFITKSCVALDGISVISMFALRLPVVSDTALSAPVW